MPMPMPTPRLELPAAGPLLFPRYVDADSLHAEDDADRAVRSQSVLRVVGLLGAANSSPTPRKQCGSPRAAAFAAPQRLRVRRSTDATPGPSPKEARSVATREQDGPVERPPPRAPSPVGEFPTDSVVSLVSLMSPPSGATTIRSPRRAILGQSDVQKITRWLQSLSRESRLLVLRALLRYAVPRESRADAGQTRPQPSADGDRVPLPVQGHECLRET